nr:kelch-like protein 12 isoform X1 [Ciona intestinalis]|eukprot:XP_002122376.3 kelch-like protein 12 isoform X1 [Ciona intestinalis]
MASNNETVIQYKSDHKGRVLTKLNRLRKRKVFTDVTFKLKDGEVSAHKNVLAGYSKYYEIMFTSGCKKGFNNTIEVKGIKASILDLLITFIYLQVINISDKIVFQLYEAANCLQFKDVKAYCVRFFNDALTVENFLCFRAFAQRYKLVEVLRKCDEFIGKNLELVAKEIKFLELPINKAKPLIALMKQQNWIKTSKSYFDVLTLEYISRLEKNQIVTIVGARAEAAYDFMVVGGTYEENLVYIYDVVGKHFREIMSTLYERWGSTSVKIHNHVYTAGGDETNSVECLNLNHFYIGWNKVSFMIEQRWFAASAVLNDQMYVTGGMNARYEALLSVEFYNPVINKWTYTALMKTKRYEHALVSYNGSLYAFGGYDGLIPLNSMESFDPQKKKWNTLKPMNERRQGLCGVVYNDQIYAIGGNELNSVERFNMRTHTWSKVSSMKYKRCGACACVVSGKIYVIGGYGDKESKMTIEVYDETSKKWRLESNMETLICFASVVAL